MKLLANESDAAGVRSSAGEGAVAITAALLAACSGGAGNDSTVPLASLKKDIHAAPSAYPASRFLAQAAFGGNDDDIAYVRTYGAAAWLNQQFTIASDQTHWDWLVSKGFNASTDINGTGGIDATLWRKLMSSPDKLRQRVALALSELFVVSLIGLPTSWKSFAIASYMDMLAASAFGNFRDLLQNVTLAPAMGVYLGTQGNQKEDPTTGREADENYSREVMQLFTIGLYELNNDGSLKYDGNGNPIATYDATTVTQLAQVFTGWNFNGYSSANPNYLQSPMILNAKNHSTTAKSFLGATVPANTDGATALKIALDTLFNHPNVPAFVGRQLIQRFVTSNPSTAYVSRVAAAFIGTGVRGDMKAVWTAVFLDREASMPIGDMSPSGGKVREPIVRLAQWAHTFNVASTSGAWAVGDTSDPSSALGQSPLRSPTVFNFFNPNFVPSNNVLGDPSLVAPELQITTESSVIGYPNFLQRAIAGQIADLVPDYSTEIALAASASDLFAHLNTLLAAGQISPTTGNIIITAVNGISPSTAAGLQNRVMATIMLIMCAPEYLVQK